MYGCVRFFTEDIQCGGMVCMFVCDKDIADSFGRRADGFERIANSL